MMGSASASAGSGRLLALDPGGKRTGIALSDPSGQIATPLETVALPLRKLIAHLTKRIAEYQIERVIIGRPQLPSGDESEMGALGAEIGRRLESATGVGIVYWDEALTSWEAAEILKERGRRKRPGEIDRLAAALILQDYMNAQRKE